MPTFLLVLLLIDYFSRTKIDKGDLSYFEFLVFNVFASIKGTIQESAAL